MSCTFHFLRYPEPFAQRKSGRDHLGQGRDNLRESHSIVSEKACHDGWAAIDAAIELILAILIQPCDDGIVPPVADTGTRNWVSLHVIGRIMKNLLAFRGHVGEPDRTRKAEHSMRLGKCLPQFWLGAGGKSGG